MQATAMLKESGILGYTDVFCPPLYGVAIFSMDCAVKLPKNCGEYSNCVDANNNPFLPIDPAKMHEQAIRMLCRQIASSLGIFNAKDGEATIFMVPVLAFLALIGQKNSPKYKGGQLIDTLILRMRRIGQIACDKTLRTSPTDQTQEGAFTMWNLGELPNISYDNPYPHCSLASNPLINPFGLSEKEWWLAMCLILGLINPQFKYLQDIIKMLGLEPNEESVTEYFRKTLGHQVNFDPVLLEVTGIPKSTLTLEEFPVGQEVGIYCHVTCTMQELEAGLCKNGCPLCRNKLPNWRVAFEQSKTIIEDPQVSLRNLVKSHKPTMWWSNPNVLGRDTVLRIAIFQAEESAKLAAKTAADAKAAPKSGPKAEKAAAAAADAKKFAEIAAAAATDLPATSAAVFISSFDAAALAAVSAGSIVPIGAAVAVAPSVPKPAVGAAAVAVAPSVPKPAAGAAAVASGAGAAAAVAVSSPVTIPDSKYGEKYISIPPGRQPQLILAIMKEHLTKLGVPFLVIGFGQTIKDFDEWKQKRDSVLIFFGINITANRKPYGCDTTDLIDQKVVFRWNGQEDLRSLVETFFSQIWM
jgi:hypothetical protein